MENIQILTCLCILSGIVPYVTGETRDVVFVLDRSGSIHQEDFEDAVDFIYNVVIWLTIGQSSNKLQISVLTFSSSTEEEFDLNDYTSKTDLLSAINQIKSKQTGGGTNTNDALRYCRQTSFTFSHGSRSGVPKAIVVLTDGQSNSASLTREQARLLHNAGFEVYAIGVGSSTSSSELEDIASDPDSYYVNTVDTFADLCNLIPVLVPKLDKDVLSAVRDECAYLNPTIKPPDMSESNAASISAVAATFAVFWVMALLIVIAKVVSIQRRDAVTTTGSSNIFGSSSLGLAQDNFAVKFHQSDMPVVEIITHKAATETVTSE